MLKTLSLGQRWILTVERSLRESADAARFAPDPADPTARQTGFENDATQVATALCFRWGPQRSFSLFGEVQLALLVAGALFCETQLPLFVAGALFGEVQVSFLAAGAKFGEIRNVFYF